MVGSHDSGSAVQFEHNVALSSLLVKVVSHLLACCINMLNWYLAALQCGCTVSFDSIFTLHERFQLSILMQHVESSDMLML